MRILDHIEALLAFIIGFAVCFAFMTVAKADCETTFKSGDVIYVQAGIPYNVTIDDPQSIHDFFNQTPVGKELPTTRAELKAPNAHLCSEGFDRISEDL